MSPPDENANIFQTDLVMDHSRFVVKWNGRRSRFGNTMLFRCLAALAAHPNKPVENDELVRRIDTGCIRNPNDVRTAIFRTKKRLIAADMADLAHRIDNMDGAYVIRL